MISTVADLISALEKLPPNANISMSQDGFFGGCIDKIKELKCARTGDPTVWIVGGWHEN